MKLLVALGAALAAIASAASAADVPECQVAQLKVLTENPNVPLCVTKSAVIFSNLHDTPTDTQLASMCKTAECVTLLGTILALDPADCTLPVEGGIALRSQLVDPAVAYCEKSGVKVSDAAAAAGGSSSSAVGSSASDSVGTVKAADTASSSPSATTTTNTSTPTPTPSSSAASHAVVAASAVVAFVAAAATLL